MQIKNDLKTSLKNLGLTPAEAEVYLFLLNGGVASAQEITKAIKLPRSTIVLAINNLLEQELIYYYIKGKRKNFVAQDPEMLINIVRKKELEFNLKKTEIRKLIPELQNIGIIRPAEDIKTEIFNGEEGFKKAYNLTLAQKKGGEILRFGISSAKFTVLPDFLRGYVKAKNKKLITTKLLLPEDNKDLLRSVMADDHNDLRETRILDKRLYNPNGNIAIWNDCVAFISWEKNLSVVLIKNKSIAEMLRMIFNTCWQSAKTKL